MVLGTPVRFFYAALLSGLVCAAVCLADSPVVEVDPSVTPEPPTPTPTLTPTPTATLEPEQEDGVVEPLGVWTAVTPKPTPTPLPTPEDVQVQPEEEHDSEGSGVDAEEDSESPEYLDEEEDPNLELIRAAQEPRTVVASKRQKKRLLAARIIRHRMMKAQRQELGLDRLRAADPRGEPEIRLCSVNIDSYSTVKEYKRVFKAAKLPNRTKIETSVVAAAQSASCDVIALQGLMGQEEEIAQEALETLQKKIQKSLGGEWTSRMGKATSGTLRNAFLVRGDKVRVNQFVSYEDKAPTSFGAFNINSVARPMIRIDLEVSGVGNASPKTREVMVFTYDFRNADGKLYEPEAHHMQMADLLRQIVHSELDNYPPERRPIVVLLGDRQGPQAAPGTQLLEGRYRLMDFTLNGKCKLQPDNKVQCDPSMVHLKEFFGVTTEGLNVEPTRKVKKDEAGEKTVLVYPSKKKMLPKEIAERKRTSEVYLSSEDLSLAQVSPTSFGRYQAGIKKVQTSLTESPLVWVELNW